MTKLKEIIPRKATLTNIYHPKDKSLLDQSLVLFFQNPHSFTGEDVIELHTHGGISVIQDTLKALSLIPGFRIAEPGEFSKRAFLNGKMDLTEVEALADLIQAETTQQRQQALKQLEGLLSKTINEWREKIILALAHVTAFIDFGDDAHIEDVDDIVLPIVNNLMKEINFHLNDPRGEQIRDGFQITLIGSPNVGKSSLMNILSKKEVSIVSNIKGTTRDIVQVRMNLDGYNVIINDTAGIRDTNDPIEIEGIKRAMNKANESNLIILIQDIENDIDYSYYFDSKKLLKIYNKKDLIKEEEKQECTYISCKNMEGIDELLDIIKKRIKKNMNSSENVLITRARHRECFQKCHDYLQLFLDNKSSHDIASEYLRESAKWLGKITGEIDLEEILDVVFREFCIGK